MAKSYICYEDPGHGWLRVPIIEIDPIKDKISPYSYIRGKYVYLEEDCDEPMFLRHKFGENFNYQELQEKGIIKTKIVDKTSIRDFENYHICTEEEKKLKEKVIGVLLSMDFKKSAMERIKKARYSDCVYWVKYYNIQV